MFENLIITYTESGRARKRCGNVNCNNYVHAKSQACTCGYEFRLGALEMYKKKESAVSMIITKRISGPGFRKCDNCKLYVGIKAKVCACGHKFSVVEKPKKTKKTEKEFITSITDEDRSFAIAYGYPSPRSYIYCPAGEYKSPKSFDDVGFDNWVETYIMDDGKLMTPTAYRYILRQNFSEEKLTGILNLFNGWLKTKI